MSIENFVVYYKNIYNEYVTYNYYDKTYKTLDRLPKNINNYYMFDKYGMSKKETENMTNEEITMELNNRLLLFSSDLINWSNELKNCICLMAEFDYLKAYTRKDGTKYYRNNYELIFLFFINYGSRMDLYNKINANKISHMEYLWFESCFNSGLTYLQKKDEIYSCYGYDFSLNYPNLMSSKDFKFPIQEGTELIFDTLPKKLKYGIYKIKFDLSTIPKNFNIVMKMVDSNSYTHYDLNFIRKTFPDVKFELIQNNKPNCLIYNDDDLISGSELFYPWFCRIYDLRRGLPKNYLVKHLASKLWGVLIEGRVEYMTEEQFENDIDNEDNVIVDIKVKKNGSLIYKIAKRGNFYKKNIRIKPFLPSYARINCANLALANIEHVVRIQTDSVIFDEPLSKSILCKYKLLLPEDKTTGEIYFKNVNSYHKI
jgi:hypothetical protein